MANGTACSADPLRCPKRGTVLQVERLIIEDEDGHDEEVCFDCPMSHFHRAITAKQGVEMMMPLIKERLKQKLYINPR